MGLMSLEVGGKIDGFLGMPEGPLFDIDDGGAVVYVKYHRPTIEELEQFKSGKRFEIRYIELNGVLNMMFKFGNLNWMDVPYHPIKSKGLNKFPIINENQGLGLTIIVVDVSKSEVQALRFIGLGTNFSRRLIGTCMDLKVHPISSEQFKKAVVNIQRFSTKDIVKMSKNYFRIDDGDITFDVSEKDERAEKSINDEKPINTRKSLEHIKQYVEKRPYPGVLPAELEEYHYYINDNETGHCIMCIPEQFYKKAKQKGFDNYECIVPVKYIMENGCRKESGYLFADIPYDEELGVTIDESYYEC